MTIPTDTQRAEFEAWAKERGGNILRHAERSHQYASSTVQGWWISWQAATERERERAATWRDIATAPKDETILGSDGYHVGEAFWHDGSACYGHRGGPGWFWECDRSDLLIARNAVLTVWMPMPVAPIAVAATEVAAIRKGET